MASSIDGVSPSITIRTTGFAVPRRLSITGEDAQARVAVGAAAAHPVAVERTRDRPLTAGDLPAQERPGSTTIQRARRQLIVGIGVQHQSSPRSPSPNPRHVHEVVGTELDFLAVSREGTLMRFALRPAPRVRDGHMDGPRLNT